jgi:hypothetical protein
VASGIDEHQHAGPSGRDFAPPGRTERLRQPGPHVSPQVLALKEKRSKHGSSSLAAERQTIGHEVEGDTEPTVPVQA